MARVSPILAKRPVQGSPGASTTHDWPDGQGGAYFSVDTRVDAVENAADASEQRRRQRTAVRTPGDYTRQQTEIFRGVNIKPMTPQATRQQPASRKQRPPTSRMIDRLTDALGGEKFVAIAALGVVAALGVGLLTSQLTAVASVATMITLGMVLTMQHTSSRESRALNVKLDELIRVTSARNEFIGAEDESHTELNQRRQELLDEREAQ